MTRPNLPSTAEIDRELAKVARASAVQIVSAPLDLPEIEDLMAETAATTVRELAGWLKQVTGQHIGEIEQREHVRRMTAAAIDEIRQLRLAAGSTTIGNA